MRKVLFVLFALFVAAQAEAGPVKWVGKKAATSVAKCGVIKAAAKGSAAAAIGVGRGAAYVGKKALRVF